MLIIMIFLNLLVGIFTPITMDAVGCFTCIAMSGKKMLIKDKDIIELHLSSSRVLKISSHECLSLWGQWLMEYLHSQRDTLWESKAWWLEPHSKEMDKGPEDSCRAALSLTNKKKNPKQQKIKKRAHCSGKIP